VLNAFHSNRTLLVILPLLVTTIPPCIDIVNSSTYLLSIDEDSVLQEVEYSNRYTRLRTYLKVARFKISIIPLGLTSLL
jgi:hypothetical protein